MKLLPIFVTILLTRSERVGLPSGRQEKHIRISTRSLNQLAQDKLQTQSNQYKRLSKRLFAQYKKRTIRWSIFALNAILLVAALFIVRSPEANQSISKSAISENNVDVAEPLDQLSSADVAVNVARMAGLAESTAVTNRADTVNIQMAMASASDAVIAKPQVISTDIKSRHDIMTYVAKKGDTINSIAAEFDVTTDTIRWSNGLSDDTIAAGTVLHILPGVNGIIYRARAGDTPDLLAARYQASKDKIIAYNDAEISGLPVGEYIIIPGGTPTATRSSFSSASVNSGGSFAPSYGYNGYDYGWCTWYVADRITVPTNWGNANTWNIYAAASGWKVSPLPPTDDVGAIIGQRTGGWAGHVAVIEAVSADGSKIKYSDMNGLAGFARIGFSDWAPASDFDNYIYR